MYLYNTVLAVEGADAVREVPLAFEAFGYVSPHLLADGREDGVL